MKRITEFDDIIRRIVTIGGFHGNVMNMHEGIVYC